MKSRCFCEAVSMTQDGWVRNFRQYKAIVIILCSLLSLYAFCHLLSQHSTDRSWKCVQEVSLEEIISFLLGNDTLSVSVEVRTQAVIGTSDSMLSHTGQWNRWLQAYLVFLGDRATAVWHGQHNAKKIKIQAVGQEDGISLARLLCFSASPGWGSS